MAIPNPVLYPLRYIAANFARKNPLRKASVEVLKLLCGGRPRVPSSLSEIRPLDMPHVSFLPSDSMVMESAYWFGVRSYEGIMSDVWMRLCEDAGNVLEVGANVGLFSVIGASRRPKKYTAVEPLPEVAAILRANLARNRLEFVEVLQGAVIASSETRDVVISIPDEGHGAPVGAHLTEHVEVSNRSSFRRIDVKGFPIAALIDGRDLVKIDAEGIEAELIGAASGTILQNRPTLVIEVLPEAQKLGGILSHLAQAAGYTIHIIPSYGSDNIIKVPAADFTSATPGNYNSKDVVLSLSSLT